MRRLIGVLGLAALALAGCATIPVGGPVLSSDIVADDDGSDIVTRAESPQPGASPVEIVQGFVRAGRDPQDGYLVAREFLAGEFAQRWSPAAGVLVTPSSIMPTEVAGGGVELTISVGATVDADGRYSASAAPETRRLDFELAKNDDGEWRITAGPDGTILPPTRFGTVFRAYSLYYFDPSFSYLVPELRWFAGSASVARRVVAELVTGESALREAGVLVSAFPTGTESGAVDVADGQATVALSSEVISAPDLSKWRMLQQLRATLLTLDDVRDVAIEVSGVPVSIPDVGATPPDRFLSVDSSLVGMADGDFGTIGAEGVAPLPGFRVDVDALKPRAASLARDRTAIALLGAGGVSLIPKNEDPVLLDGRGGLVPPTIDPWGYTWSVPASDPSGLIAFDAEGRAHPVPASVSGTVRSIDVSRDGTRLLIALDGPDGSRLVIAGIDRDDKLAPTALVPADSLQLGTGSVVSAVWVDTASVAAIVGLDDRRTLVSLSLGGPRTSLGDVAAASALTSGNSGAGLRVVDAAGEVFRSTGAGVWFDTGTRVDFLAIPH